VRRKYVVFTRPADLCERQLRPVLLFPRPGLRRGCSVTGTAGESGGRGCLTGRWPGERSLVAHSGCPPARALSSWVRGRLGDHPQHAAEYLHSAVVESVLGWVMWVTGEAARYVLCDAGTRRTALPIRLLTAGVRARPGVRAPAGEAGTAGDAVAAVDEAAAVRAARQVTRRLERSREVKLYGPLARRRRHFSVRSRYTRWSV
jgi:hypothetical protein